MAFNHDPDLGGSASSTEVSSTITSTKSSPLMAGCRWMVILDKQPVGCPPSTHNEDRPLNLKAQGAKEASFFESNGSMGGCRSINHWMPDRTPLGAGIGFLENSIAPSDLFEESRQRRLASTMCTTPQIEKRLFSYCRSAKGKGACNPH
ncbi:hypothetical protein ACP70R_019002 [Stipagrostis hirtigluma subsp. patula]